MPYDYKNEPTNPDAIPLYNDSILKFWNWFDDTWNCNDYVTWHKAMKSRYGLGYANTNFLKYWDDLATGSFAIDCRTFDVAFRDYMKNVGLFDSLYSGVGIITKPIGVASDVVNDAGDIISDVSDGAKKTAKTLATLLPVILIIAIIFVAIYFFKKYNLKMKMQ